MLDKNIDTLIPQGAETEVNVSIQEDDKYIYLVIDWNSKEYEEGKSEFGNC